MTAATGPSSVFSVSESGGREGLSPEEILERLDREYPKF